MDNVIGQVVFDEQGKATLLTHYAFLTGATALRGGREVPVIRVACQSETVYGWRCSDDTHAVNCPACLMTTEFLIASVQKAPVADVTMHYAVGGVSVCGHGRRLTEDVRGVDCRECLGSGVYRDSSDRLRSVTRTWKG